MAIKAVAEKLGNTPSVCRRRYVDPVRTDSHLRHSIVSVKQMRPLKDCAGKEHEPTPEKASVIALLMQKIA